MPVHRADSAHDRVGAYNRLSASQANTYRACPRLWYYQRVYRFKMPQIPVLFVGRAVEEALCRVLRDSPGLLTGGAPGDTLGPSPYLDDGEPVPKGEAAWPADGLMPLFPHERPDSMAALENWALQRCAVHLPTALERAKEAWATDERRSGDWSEVDGQACLAMVEAGVRFHLAEVERCVAAGGGPYLDAWRNGERVAHPSPDGFSPQSFPSGHPLATDGEVTWTEAWELARPWFVDPDAPSFSMNAVHPEHWFQGEYDLVYRWSGKTVIVDIKASLGANDRSGDYVDQMRAYAMLWFVTHGRKETVDGLEIWYLKHPSIKSVGLPSVTELNAIEEELEDLWKQLRKNTPSIEACPPNPAPLRGYAPGGIPTTPPDGSRCSLCDWRSVCPGGDGPEGVNVPDVYQLPGTVQSIRIEPIGPLNPRITVRGELFAVGRASGGRPQTMTLTQGHHSAQLQVVATTHSDGSPTVAFDAERGAAVLVRDAVFTVNWKGEIVLKLDPLARLEEDADPDTVSSSLFDVQAKHHLGGMVVYTYEKSGIGKTGKRWSRKGMMVMDDSGATKIEGWADDWNPQYDLVEPGDIVVVANVGLDAWATEVRADYTRQSTLQIVHRVDRSTA